MILETPQGTRWSIEHAARKLALRAELPGARVFDLAAHALRQAKEAGVSVESRLVLALPASWLVNSPAVSRVLKRWALPPQRAVWLDLIAALEAKQSAEAAAWAQKLGDEPYAVEAVSKVLALLVPDAVPLMPPAACAFVLGVTAVADATTFKAMIDWFGAAVAAWRSELAELAAAHDVVPLEPAQVLDRLLWFDSDGQKHFPKL